MHQHPHTRRTSPAEHLALLAAACVTHEKVRFTYRAAKGQETRRLAEPHSLVAAGRRWYLVAHDCDRADWRTFRLDRLTDPLRTGARVPPRDLPGGVNAATWVSTTLSGTAGHRALLLVHAPAEQVADRVPATLGVVEPVNDHTCRLLTGADSLEYLAYRIAVLGYDFDVLDPPELGPHLRTLGTPAGREPNLELREHREVRRAQGLRPRHRRRPSRLTSCASVRQPVQLVRQGFGDGTDAAV
ncbi:helix-turn-helix transcriptional regulator [Streptomyces roseifaciens]